MDWVNVATAAVLTLTLVFGEGWWMRLRDRPRLVMQAQLTQNPETHRPCVNVYIGNHGRRALQELSISTCLFSPQGGYVHSGWEADEFAGWERSPEDWRRLASHAFHQVVVDVAEFGTDPEGPHVGSGYVIAQVSGRKPYFTKSVSWWVSVDQKRLKRVRPFMSGWWRLRRTHGRLEKRMRKAFGWT